MTLKMFEDIFIKAQIYVTAEQFETFIDEFWTQFSSYQYNI